MCGCLSLAPYWGPGPQPSHVPWLGIELVTLWFTGWHWIHWATPARAHLVLFYSAIPLPMLLPSRAGNHIYVQNRAGLGTNQRESSPTPAPAVWWCGPGRLDLFSRHTLHLDLYMWNCKKFKCHQISQTFNACRLWLPGPLVGNGSCGTAVVNTRPVKTVQYPVKESLTCRPKRGSAKSYLPGRSGRKFLTGLVLVGI